MSSVAVKSEDARTSSPTSADVYVPEFEMTTGEMTPELKNSISHRGKALEQMKEILKGKL